MSDKKNLLNKLFEKTLCELESGMNDWMRQGNPIGHLFSIPIKNDNGGWQTGPGSPQEIVPNWSNVIEQVFGEQLEKLKVLHVLKNIFQIYFESDHPPPIQSFGPDLTHEIKLFLIDFLEASIIKNGFIEFPHRTSLINRACDFLTRKVDIYQSSSPLFGLRLDEEIEFNFGKIIPLNWEERVNLLKVKQANMFNQISNSMQIGSVLNTESLISVSFEKKREKKNTLIFPTEIQNLTNNAVQLLRIYDYGVLQVLWTDFFLESVSKRYRGSNSPQIGNQFPPQASEIYKIDNKSEFIFFLNTFLKSERFEERELTFIFNRLNEAWLRGRTNNFRVFDYVSILEALLVSANDGEFSFKVSILIAAFSGIDEESKKNIYNLIRKAYKVRSKVAHCAKEIPLKEQLTLDELRKLGKITHPIIRYAMEHGEADLKDEAINRLFS
ncbi:MAG: hypothetical protein ACYCT9_03005 [Leptospirillum sp.]|jgi:hypothetical protein